MDGRCRHAGAGRCLSAAVQFQRVHVTCITVRHFMPTTHLMPDQRKHCHVHDFLVESFCTDLVLHLAHLALTDLQAAEAKAAGRWRLGSPACGAEGKGGDHAVHGRWTFAGRIPSTPSPETECTPPDRVDTNRDWPPANAFMWAARFKSRKVGKRGHRNVRASGSFWPTRRLPTNSASIAAARRNR